MLGFGKEEEGWNGSGRRWVRRVGTEREGVEEGWTEEEEGSRGLGRKGRVDGGVGKEKE